MKTYFFYSKSQQAIKIGRSERPEARVCEMQTVCPDIVMCGYVEGDLESRYHEEFRSLHLTREWFRSDGALADFVRTSFKFKLPYHVISLPSRDSIILALDDLGDQSGATLITHGTGEDFFGAWHDLLSCEYPECDEGCKDYDCETCDEKAIFMEAAWDIGRLWDQVLGYSFRQADLYFSLVVVFWMPETHYAQTKLYERCLDFSFSINDDTELFTFDCFFMFRSGEPIGLQEFNFMLNPKLKAEYEALEAQLKDGSCPILK